MSDIPYRGWFRLDGVEIANSARVVAHLGIDTPTRDSMVWGTGQACTLVEVPGHPGLYQMPVSSQQIKPGLYTPPDGARKVDPGLFEVGPQCWTVNNLCNWCAPIVTYDDSWTGLQAFLQDTIYRPELAPWYRKNIPESGEFGGVWIMEAKGFGPAPIERPITALIRSGAAAGRHRDAAPTLTFTALLIACTNAGVNYGLEWLACQLRETKDRTDSVLRFLAAHPEGSSADPADLVRELHGVVLTKAPEVEEQIAPRGPNQQAAMYRVSWEMVALHPHAYAPAVVLPANWTSITEQPIQWVHEADCDTPESCSDMPVLFGQECVLDPIDVSYQPPPVCGGCLPVCSVMTYVYSVPAGVHPIRCDETTMSTTVTNTGAGYLTCQTFWRLATVSDVCDDNRFPAQIGGLQSGASVVFDAIEGRYWAVVSGRKHRPVGIVSTPTGAPWEPPVIDRARVWEFVVVAPTSASFTVEFSMADREA